MKRQVQLDSDEDANKSATAVKLELNQDEAFILLKACRRYRSTIPSYLQARQVELEIIDFFINKLAG